MALGWTENAAFRELNYELAVKTVDDFKRHALKLLRLIWPNTVGTPRHRHFGGKGADHLVWSDDPPFPVVVQCKGWEVDDDLISRDHIDQCIASIESFRNGGLKADRYLLIHNRTGKNEELRREAQARLQALVDIGQVKQAELWDRRRFVQETMQAFYERCLLNIEQLNLNRFETYQQMEPIQWEPIPEVPLKSSVLKVDQYRLIKEREGNSKTADPCHEILSADESLCLLVGPAGFGKSVTTFRIVKAGARKAIYIPAAAITKTATTTTEFLRQAISVSDLLKDSLPEDLEVHELIAREVVASILKRGDAPFLMILDGVDESIYFNKKDGVQQLFNIIKEEIGVPVLLTARSEYWQRKEIDFSTSSGITSRDAPRKVRKIRFIELQEWDEERILELVERVRAQTRAPEQLKRLNILRDLIADGRYKDFYGDIPKRPLFLRFIIETVLARDPHRVNRAQLFYEWACQKVLRDIGNPKQFGGRRVSIAGEKDEQTTIELAFLAMTHAAALMARVEGGAVELLPSCCFDSLSDAHPRLRDIKESTGVVLNSLLIPIKTSLGEASSVGFAHRLFQEYFLARAIKERIRDFGNAAVPASVQEWIDDLCSKDQTTYAKRPASSAPKERSNFESPLASAVVSEEGQDEQPMKSNVDNQTLADRGGAAYGDHASNNTAITGPVGRDVVVNVHPSPTQPGGVHDHKAIKEYEVALQVKKAVLRARDAMFFARGTGSGADFQSKLKGIAESMSALREQLREAEAHWGEKVWDTSKELERCALKLKQGFDRHERYTRHPKDLDPSYWEEHIENIIWENPVNDPLTQEIEKAVGQILSFLDPYLLNPSRD
jgi:hypothetical protein